MSCRFLGVLLTLSLLTTAVPAQESGSRAESIRKQREEMARKPVPSDTDPVERAVEWLYDSDAYNVFRYGWHGIYPVTGGLINASGIAFGAQYLRRFGEDDVIVRSSARMSLRKYGMADFEVGLPRLAGDHAYLDFYTRYRNLPGVPYYGPGPDSKETGGTAYRLEDTTFDLSTGVKPHRMLRLGATGGLLKMNVGPGDNDRFISTERVYSPRQVPGLDQQSDFLRGGVLLQLDYRDNPGGPRKGGNYYARFDYYRDQDFRRYSFRRLTGEFQQFIPFTNGKRMFALRGRSISSFENPGQVVPFYLQPSLGGADDLRGFFPFRYHDNNSLVFNGEYRWEVLSGVDAALFADAGKVFPRPGMINFTGMQKSYGAGLRFRSANGVYLRTDVGVSREGIRIWFIFNDVFATPQVRTGREISPPPGRLP